MKRKHEGQGAFDWNPPAETVPEPTASPPAQPGRTLDAEGHAYWAAFAGERVIQCMKRACEAPEHAREYAEIAQVWKQIRAKHEGGLK